MPSALRREHDGAEAGAGLERLKGALEVLVQEAQDRLRDRPGGARSGLIDVEFRRVREEFVDRHTASFPPRAIRSPSRMEATRHVSPDTGGTFHQRADEADLASVRG